MLRFPSILHRARRTCLEVSPPTTPTFPQATVPRSGNASLSLPHSPKAWSLVQKARCFPYTVLPQTLLAAARPLGRTLTSERARTSHACTLTCTHLLRVQYSTAGVRPSRAGLYHLLRPRLGPHPQVCPCSPAYLPPLNVSPNTSASRENGGKEKNTTEERKTGRGRGQVRRRECVDGGPLTPYVLPSGRI